MRGKPLKWRRRDIVWDFNKGDDVLKLNEEKNINPDAIDFFGKKLVRIGTLLRIGNQEMHGNRYYAIISNDKKLTLSEKIMGKVEARLDPDSYRKKMEERKETLKNWNDQHIMIDHEWIFETPDEDTQVSESKNSVY